MVLVCTATVASAPAPQHWRIFCSSNTFFIIKNVLEIRIHQIIKYKMYCCRVQASHQCWILWGGDVPSWFVLSGRRQVGGLNKSRSLAPPHHLTKSKDLKYARDRPICSVLCEIELEFCTCRLTFSHLCHQSTLNTRHLANLECNRRLPELDYCKCVCHFCLDSLLTRVTLTR